MGEPAARASGRTGTEGPVPRVAVVAARPCAVRHGAEMHGGHLRQCLIPSDC